MSERPTTSPTRVTAPPSAAGLAVHAGPLPTAVQLSVREQEVLHCLARGDSGPRTAQRLGISVCTVRSHVRNIVRKLHACNIPHAVARAFHIGVLDIDVPSKSR